MSIRVASRAVPGATGPAGGTVVTVLAKTASFTVASEDAGKLHRASSVGAIVVTVPANATDAIPVGSVFPLRRTGTGGVAVAAAGGVTINSVYSYLTLARQGSPVVLTKVGTDEWDLDGDLA